MPSCCSLAISSHGLGGTQFQFQGPTRSLARGWDPKHTSKKAQPRGETSLDLAVDSGIVHLTLSLTFVEENWG